MFSRISICVRGKTTALYFKKKISQRDLSSRKYCAFKSVNKNFSPNIYFYYVEIGIIFNCRSDIVPAFYAGLLSRYLFLLRGALLSQIVLICLLCISF